MHKYENLPPLRIGFVGGHGHHYLAGALTDESVAVEAVAMASDGRDADAARRRAERMPGSQWFDSPEQLFDEFRPNVVSVGAVYALNGPIARMALERNILTVTDKPAAATWEDYWALREAASGRRLVIEFDFRCWASFRAAKLAVERGRIGDVVLVNAQKSYRFGSNRPDFYRRREEYASTLIWIASHAIDVIPFVTGHSYTRVVAQHGNVARKDFGSMEDHAAAMFTLDNGGTAVVHADFHQPQASKRHGDDRLRVVGSLGILEVRDRRCMLTTHDAPDTDITNEAEEVPVHRAYLDALFRGDETYYSTAATLATSALLLHTRDAADSGEAIILSET